MYSNSRLIIGLAMTAFSLIASVPHAFAGGQSALSDYKNCIESVVFELRKKTTENRGAVRINTSWTKQGDLIAIVNTGGNDMDVGPDTPEQVLFKVEQIISPDISMIRDSLVYKMCGSGGIK